MKKALLQIKNPLILLGVLMLGVFVPINAHAGGLTDFALKVAGVSGESVVDVVALILSFISLFLLKLASLANMLSGLLLNLVINFTVVDMAKNYTGITAISDTWTVMRDIANMSFIFVLLYASIQKILGKGDVNRLIVNMVIAALLINFSLFFTKIIIDASNLIALTFYNSIAPGGTSKLLDVGLSNSIMQPLHLQTIWSLNGVKIGDPKTTAIVGIMGTLFTLIATFVFLAVSLLFIIRYVVLIFVLILSPIFFLASILPSLKKFKDQWVSALTGQALFAPLYMLMTWITLKVFSNLSFDTGTLKLGFADAVAGTMDPATKVITYPPGAINVFLNFVIVIAFLIISIVVAKSTSDSSGKGMSKITGKAFGFAGGASVGLAGRFGRGTAGRFGQALADNEYLKEKAPNSRIARLTLAAGNKTATTSFDARNLGALGQLNAGKGVKGGFIKDVENKVKAEKDYADKAFKPSELIINQAETELKAAQKTGDKAAVDKAQERVDKLKGADEAEMRKRKILEIRKEEGIGEKAAKKKLGNLEEEKSADVARLMKEDPALSEEDAKEKSEAGWTPPKAIVSAQNIRKEEYAKNIEKIGFMNRVAFVGDLRRESKLQAAAIRKSMKEKSKNDALADAAKAVAKEEADSTSSKDAESDTKPTNATTPDPAAGDKPKSNGPFE